MDLLAGIKIESYSLALSATYNEDSEFHFSATQKPSCKFFSLLIEILEIRHCQRRWVFQVARLIHIALFWTYSQAYD